MFLSKDTFKDEYVAKIEAIYGKKFEDTTVREQYETLGLMIKEYISHQWIATNENTRSMHKKQVYYLSIEFLLGRLLGSNVLNLGIYDIVEGGLKDLNIDLENLEEVEIDAGLGNGGLGRLAACFLDSLATLDLPGHGCGIRYRHGLFDQKIVDGYQVEYPEQWLKNGNVWERCCSDEAVKVRFWGQVEPTNVNGRLEFPVANYEEVLAVPYDIPVIGYHNETINTLRLWSAETVMTPPNKNIVTYTRETEAISEFLYPDDSTDEGKILRLKQQYFLVSASLQNIIRQYKLDNDNLRNLHQHIAIHINDTHPALGIPELMRILLDEEKMSWEEAWYITRQTFAYTNHTTLSEALEKWPIRIFQPLLPRVYQIVEEINERFCKEIWEKYPYDWNRIESMAIIAHDVVKMAHLAITGSFSVNGVAKIHTEILKKREMNLFYQFYPEKFNNKTNGITHRRWLLKANPQLTNLVKDAIGEDFISHPEQLQKLIYFKDNHSFQQDLEKVKKERKDILANIIKDQTGIIVDTNSIFDVQVKRLHAYKRQLLNILHIMYLYNRLKEDSNFKIPPRTFIFGAKASPGYYYAKKVIKLINAVADKVNNDPQTKDVLKVVFLENYRVSLAEKIFPASDVSEQISTASKEASGTGNMKFMMNGAVTIGTLDGANVEMMEEVGSDNIFIFGLTADEVLQYNKNGGYHPSDYYHYDGRIQTVLNQLINGFFSNVKSGEFSTLYYSLMQQDEYFVLKDFASYLEAQEAVGKAYEDREKWMQMSIANIAKSGQFSSDRTIKEYAKDIWKIEQGLYVY